MRAAPAAAAALLARSRVVARAMGASPQAGDIARDKAALRRAVRAALAAADDGDLRHQSEWARMRVAGGCGARGGSPTAGPPLVSALSGAAVCAHLLAASFWTTASNVGAYVAAPRLREVDPGAAVAAALASAAPTVFVPVVGAAPASMRLLHLEVESGLIETPPYGIREPTDDYPSTGAPRRDALDAGLDVLLLPGAAFDESGRRLGRGGGYYDAFVAAARAASRARGAPPPLLVGLAFTQQLHPIVPVEPHDAVLDILVTAAGVAAVSERGELAVAGR